MSSSTSVLRLYREMLRNASKFEVLRAFYCLRALFCGGYNVRSYALRRVKADFHKNKTLTAGSAEQEKALDFAREQANVLYRQVVISKLYPPQGKSVLETLGA
ncbi:hypothetical protein BBJ28_00012873 [Nothophytophthora sp. Chile5]|nr:hypothetical protein BBJ28_00012873 [Nothophytophthora sp. Chile5]